jgi:hypothetical protein
MPLSHLTLYHGVGEDNAAGRTPTAPTAADPDLQRSSTAPDPQSAADAAVATGNRTHHDDHRGRWPSEVRSVSAGDLHHITSAGGGTELYPAASAGVDPPPELTDPVVPLAGTRATRRTRTGGTPQTETPRNGQS